ncbi:MAG: IS982 family transposase [Chloroflexi bacterium]|nr:IS982 family transposase [Chloroflexota bacterium]
MIDNFDDFCLWTYVVVDELWQRIAPLFRRPGPAPECSDSELLTLALVGECRGWDLETALLSHWQDHRDLFPVLPSQSRFNRRRRRLVDAFNLVRRAILGLLDAAADHQGVIDSLPVPVIAFHLVPGSAATANWRAAGAAFGKVTTKEQTIFGYKLHLLITLGGVILDFELAPANAADLTAGEELLSEHTDLAVIGDKAYISEAVASALWEQRHIALLTIPRRNQQRQLPPAVCRLLNRARQIIETVNDQLKEQFHVEVNHAHTFPGLATRLHTKLAAHTLCLYLNHLLGKENFLQIKALAFPN